MRRRLLPCLLTLAAVATTTGFVANRLLDRPGESAFQYVPENALGVLSFDLVPAPDQILAFKHIDATIAAANGGKTDVGSFLAAAFGDEGLRPLLSQVDRSVALAALPAPGKADAKDAGIVAFVALKDPAAFETSLQRLGRKEVVAGATVYWSAAKSTGKLAIMVHDQYAVVSDRAWPLAAVSAVIRGKVQPITAASAFAAARGRALGSSNLLVLVNPQTAKSEDWLVASMAIRETGWEMAVSGQTNDPDVRKAGSLKPLDAAVLDALPRGAYGFVAASQPGPAVALGGSALDETQKSMSKQTDLDLKGDVLPALGGNVVLGFYPSFGPDAGLDLLVSVDDANGADPASLARKLESRLGKEMEKTAKGAWKTSVETGGGRVSRLADEPTNEMRQGIRDLERSFFRPLTLSKDKTVAWANVGKSVLLATSQDLLARAIVARQNPSPTLGLSGDGALGARPASAVDGQFALAIGVRRLVEGLRNTIDPSHMAPEAARTYRRTLALYDGTTEPFAMRARMDPAGRYQAYFSAPVDWSKLPEMVK